MNTVTTLNSEATKNVVLECWDGLSDKVEDRQANKDYIQDHAIDTRGKPARSEEVEQWLDKFYHRFN